MPSTEPTSVACWGLQVGENTVYRIPLRPVTLFLQWQQFGQMLSWSVHFPHPKTVRVVECHSPVYTSRRQQQVIGVCCLSSLDDVTSLGSVIVDNHEQEYR
ncbi:hypothetical protein AcW1_008111 [Taiwanofungus camphoratus]|nr:hypothetical protein AcV5_008411 [Antrodia cinnamomea]KAI0950941.1 hypothetical protein AcW1_008111 [Antrodia cinnamomea]KAI0955852.1 hypothetical protein AcV7_006404 [Antrodia cinnamomea]